MLWCTTYILCLYECERYWTTDANSLKELGSRDEVIRTIGGVRSADYQLLNELACWAWNRRFAYQPYLLEMGSLITFEMLQQLMYFTDGALNVFSAHDYTILGILALLQITQREGGIERPIQFASYLTMELWSKAPPAHHTETSRPGGSNSNSNSFDPGRSDGTHNSPVTPELEPGSSQIAADATDATNVAGAAAGTGSKLLCASPDQRVVRIILNDSPFDSADQKVVHKMQKKFSRARDVKEQEAFMYAWPVQEDRERVVLQLTMPELTVLMGNLYEGMRAASLGPNLHKENNFIDWSFKYLQGFCCWVLLSICTYTPLEAGIATFSSLGGMITVFFTRTFVSHYVTV